jgi:Outer membrane lipoprotein-sorting protein
VISRAQFVCSILICFAVAAGVSAQTQSTVPTSDDIVVRMAQAQAENRTRFLPYIVTRDYKLFEAENRDQAKSHVIAEITVVPSGAKKYVIENAEGSGLAERIVRKALDGEVAVAKDSRSADITGDNYDFLLVREDKLNGQRCYVLELLPRRKSKNLLRGTIWVDAESYLPYRVEGEPARSPSWWLTDIRIVLLYGYVGPMWIQTSSEATANVRIIGRSSMVWQGVSYQVGELTPGASLAQTILPVREAATKGQR